MQRHVTTCWHCIDHFCRMAEVVELLRRVEPLSEAETQRFRKALGITVPKQPVWKRWMAQ
jgi:hypothetical protein